MVVLSVMNLTHEENTRPISARARWTNAVQGFVGQNEDEIGRASQRARAQRRCTGSE